MNNGKLTGRLQDVLHKIGDLENKRELVTLQRVARELNLARQNVWTYVTDLQRRGLVVYAPTERFTTPIRLSDAGWAASGLPRTAAHGLRFPILGEVAAGQPTLATEHLEGEAILLTDVLPLHDGDFLLRVRGDSMTGIGIYHDDFVAIHPSPEEPLPGEIVLVEFPGENTATLKRWERHNGTVTLHSENPDYAPMTFPADEVSVRGCLVGHIGTGRARRTWPTRAPRADS